MSLSYAGQCAYEVEWYRVHGTHPSRIRKDEKGMAYVVGDWRWNHDHPSGHEVIAPQMREHIAQKMTDLKA